jgi:hypothetical protein
MQAIRVVLEVLNINVVEKVTEKPRSGPKGYKLLLRLRILLYAVLMELFETRNLARHLRKKPGVLCKLGFRSVPSRRTLDRWKKKHNFELGQVIKLVGDRYLQLNESEWTILDSTPIVDENDPDATVGYNSRGQFIGFKLHMSCDEYEVPLRAVFTQAHVHDRQKGDELLAPTPKAGGDSAYDCKELKKNAKIGGTKLITSHNPRREGKAAKKPTPKMLKKVRVVIEQCNGFVKSKVMKHAWNIIIGLKAKATFALTAVLAVQALAIYNLIHHGYPSIRIAELRA